MNINENLNLFLILAVVAIVSVPIAYALVESSIVINMLSGQTTDPFVVKDFFGVEVFTVKSTGNLDLKNNNLIVGTGDLQFDSVTKTITFATNNMLLDVPATGQFSFRVNDNLEYSMSVTQLDVIGNNLVNVGSFESNAVSTPTIGVIKLGNNEQIVWRNELGNADIIALEVDNNNNLKIDTNIQMVTGSGTTKGSILGVDDLTFTANVFSPSSSIPFINRVGSDLNINVPSGNNIILKEAGVSKFEVSSTFSKIKFFENLDVGTNFIDISEIATPANPSVNSGRLYVKDVAGTTTLFFRDSFGVETNLLAGGGGGEVFTWTADHDASGFNLDNFGVARISFGTTDTTFSNEKVVISGERLQTAKGADRVSAGALILGDDGNYFHITGTNTIQTITGGNWQAGSVVILHFDSALQVVHDSGGVNPIFFASNTFKNMVSGDVLTLVFDDPKWIEVSCTC